MLSEREKPFCSSCADILQPITSLIYHLPRGRKLSIFAAGIYDEPLKSLVLAKRTHDRLAFKHLAYLILERTPLATMPIDYFVPVPLHWRRYAQRGYNQAAVMAQGLSQELSVPVINPLKRVAYGPYLSTLSGNKMRTEAVQGAFQLKSGDTFACLEGKNIMLVDDLCATGGTLQECARGLLKLKVASVNAVVGCRSILR